MNKRQDTVLHSVPSARPGEEAEVRRLLESAGPRPAMPADELAAIKAAARGEWQRMVAEEGARRRRAWRPLALAASLVVAIGAVWLWLAGTWTAGPTAVATVEMLSGSVAVDSPEMTRPSRLALGQTLAAGSELETASGSEASPARVALRLGDGPSLRLDRGTRVRLVSATEVELSAGAVYVDSPPGSAVAAAVEIVTAWGRVREIGTQFEVRLGAGDGLTVRVREGAVAVRRNGDTHSAEAGEELRLAADGTVSRGTLPAFSEAWGWAVAAAPPADFEGRALGEFLDWAARESGWEVRWADGPLAAAGRAIELHGPEGLSLEDAVEAYLTGGGLVYRIEDGVLWIDRGDR